MTSSQVEQASKSTRTEAEVRTMRLNRAAPEMLRVLEIVEAALAVGNGINRRSQPIGGKTYISQIRAAIAKARVAP